MNQTSNIPKLLDKERLTRLLLSVFGSSLGFLTAIALITLSHGAMASPHESHSPCSLELSALQTNRLESAPSEAGWTWTFDNDILVPSSRDQDYTYGLSFNTLTSRSTPLASSLHWLNSKLGLQRRFGFEARGANWIEFGAYGFTPEVKNNVQPDSGDRPYASILYVSASKAHATDNPNVFWKTSLSLGVLGLDLVGNLQNEIHKLTGSEHVEGWDSQISDGGEPTLRYSVSRHRRWDTGQPNLELKTSSALTLGYISEVSYGINARFGKIQSSWRSQSHELAMYGEHARQARANRGDQECYWLLGAATKVRAYNAFLQGQFRTSDVTFSASELNHIILEAWVGYSHAFSGGYRFTYLLRGHTSEVKEGIANRNVIWGGLTLSRVI